MPSRVMHGAATNNHFLNLTEQKSTPSNGSGSNPRNYRRRQSQQSNLAKFAMQSNNLTQQEQLDHANDAHSPDDKDVDQLRNQLDRTLSQNGDGHLESANGHERPTHLQPRSISGVMNGLKPEPTCATALNDTPATSTPNSPNLQGNRTSVPDSASLTLGMPVRTPGSGSSTPRIRPTTLDIPGLTKSKVSPDGRIAKRDVGAKLVIVMVGLPARGKSYITKKLARYLNWLQHDTKIFNVGERRRVVAGGPQAPERTRSRSYQRTSFGAASLPADVEHLALGSPTLAVRPSLAQILLNDETKLDIPSTPLQTTEPISNGIPADMHGDAYAFAEEDLHLPDFGEPQSPPPSNKKSHNADPMDQDAAFFDPENRKASQIREQLARETLDELLDFILEQNGSVGILDATNSTVERRKMVMDRIRERAGPDLNVLFLESRCVDPDLLEANMKLKLSGPDYKDTDPEIALADFRKRVQAYEKAYVPLGEYEERHNLPYIQMIDVGRKVISHQIRGFLSAQTNYYLLNFNLAPRQIWITRHGLSVDNISGKIGGDCELAPEGHQYAKSLVRFMDEMRKQWDMKQLRALANSHFPPQPGDVTPPNPHYQIQSPTAASDCGGSSASASTDGMEIATPAFCVWTSMLKRSIETAQYFNDEDYDVKQMRMLDELNAGQMEGLTYNSIATEHPEEYMLRKKDKLHYRYPGPGGEGYLDIINRLRPVIVELERMTDNVLLIGHRSVARVLLAYFRGLKRTEVADVEVPIGMLYCLEPKPYGVDFKAYKWDKATEWFYEQPNFQLKMGQDDT